MEYTSDNGNEKIGSPGKHPKKSPFGDDISWLKDELQRRGSSSIPDSSSDEQPIEENADRQAVEENADRQTEQPAVRVVRRDEATPGKRSVRKNSAPSPQTAAFYNDYDYPNVKKRSRKSMFPVILICLLLVAGAAAFLYLHGSEPGSIVLPWNRVKTISSDGQTASVTPAPTQAVYTPAPTSVLPPTQTPAASVPDLSNDMYPAAQYTSTPAPTEPAAQTPTPLPTEYTDAYTAAQYTYTPAPTEPAAQTLAPLPTEYTDAYTAAQYTYTPAATEPAAQTPVPLPTEYTDTYTAAQYTYTPAATMDAADSATEEIPVPASPLPSDPYAVWQQTETVPSQEAVSAGPTALVSPEPVVSAADLSYFSVWTAASLYEYLTSGELKENEYVTETDTAVVYSAMVDLLALEILADSSDAPVSIVHIRDVNSTAKVDLIYKAVSRIFAGAEVSAATSWLSANLYQNASTQFNDVNLIIHRTGSGHADFYMCDDTHLSVLLS